MFRVSRETLHSEPPRSPLPGNRSCNSLECLNNECTICYVVFAVGLTEGVT
jgi:hypothetical protein